VVVDGVYSMDGDIAPIPDIVRVVQEEGAFLLVDEAHSIGVLGDCGRGVVEYFDVDPRMIDIRTGSLNKAIPAAGGFVAANATVLLLLRYGSAGATFSGALLPSSVLAADAAIRIIESEPNCLLHLHANARFFRSALRDVGVLPLGENTPIVPIPVGSQDATFAAASALLERGVHLNAIIPPGVRSGGERLRCFISADHTEADLFYAARAIGEVLAQIK
jgi:7-keto-8-aminopelargonate synthetase-like enzyme